MRFVATFTFVFSAIGISCFSSRKPRLPKTTLLLKETVSYKCSRLVFQPKNKLRNLFFPHKQMVNSWICYQKCIFTDASLWAKSLLKFHKENHSAVSGKVWFIQRNTNNYASVQKEKWCSSVSSLWLKFPCFCVQICKCCYRQSSHNQNITFHAYSLSLIL